MSRAGVMEYDDTRVENSRAYCEMCGSETDAEGLAKSCEESHTEREAGALKAIEFMVRMASDDPLACIVAMISMGQSIPSCRHIADRLGIPKTTVNEAQMRIERFTPEIAAIAGRQTAAALSQRARRAFERIQEGELNPEQMDLF